MTPLPASAPGPNHPRAGRAWLAAGLALLLAGLLYGGVRWLLDSSARPLSIGVVQLTEVDSETFEGFREAMAEFGYREGKDVRYLYPGPAGSIERLDGIIAEQLAAGVDLLLVSSTPATQAAQRATASSGTPVVFAPVNDPIQAGIVPSLQTPGGNITGIRLPQGDALRLQWLLKLAPQVQRVLFTYNPADQSALESLRQMQAVSGGLGVELLAQPIPDPQQLPRYLQAMPAEVDALLLPRDSSLEARIADYVAVARQRAIPLCAPSLTQVRAGALVSYGFVHREIGRQAARLADQILRGVPPADLPVETAYSYLALNLGAARDIGLALPADVLRQAHLVIREEDAPAR